MKLWLNQWDDVQKSRKIYRLLHDAFLSNEQRCGICYIILNGLCQCVCGNNKKATMRPTKGRQFCEFGNLSGTCVVESFRRRRRDNFLAVE